MKKYYSLRCLVVSVCFLSAAACRLPMAPKSCTGQPKTWVFFSEFGLCVDYKPGYCQVNANKFYSKAECEEYCGVVKNGERTKGI